MTSRGTLPLPEVVFVRNGNAFNCFKLPKLVFIPLIIGWLIYRNNKIIVYFLFFLMPNNFVDILTLFSTLSHDLALSAEDCNLIRWDSEISHHFLCHRLVISDNGGNLRNFCTKVKKRSNTFLRLLSKYVHILDDLKLVREIIHFLT